ncbi:hypothetical protein [Vibrio hepatarius]|uniref:hypothetical protein n=1 Tax=Vibrio hepatarius TaxID=171383 RepID=UPI001C081C77|nr:hypothetical protein [Vibrio hepatarius]MBU2898999.1 hypothetical protein [Vibrio hepatarius]
MKLRHLILFFAILSTNVLAAGFCTIGDEFTILDKEAFNRLSEKNYASFSEGITPEELFPTAPNHFSAESTNLSETKYVYNETSTLLEAGPESSVALEAEEASRLLSSIGRTASEVGGAALEVLGPIGGAVAVGFWARDVAQAFEDESRTSYDRFATVMELVDWFGVLKLPQRSIDRHILINRWNNMAAGDHYSFTIHDDIVTRQDLRDKRHWASLAANQHKTIEAIVKSYASDVALKYQAYYQESVRAQTVLSNQLITTVDKELNKTLFFQLDINKDRNRLFSSDIRSVCQPEVDAVYALYSQQRSNSLTSASPSTRAAVNALSALQHCQNSVLEQMITKLDQLRSNNLSGLDRNSLTQLYVRTLNAKKKIAETADNHVRIISTKLQSLMRGEGLQLIDKLFDSGVIANTNDFFKEQASRYAVDEMARSLLYRPATARELSSKVLVLQASYQSCSRLGILGGDPNFRGCVEYTRVPAETRRFEPSQDEVVREIKVPVREHYYSIFNETLNTLIQNGWNPETEEQWLEQQILSYSEHQRNIKQNVTTKAQVYRWLFDSRQQLGSDCIGEQSCAGWSASYLAKENLSRTSSLDDIARWLASYSGRGQYVHRKRVEQLDELIEPALESEWKATQGRQFYSYVYPNSFDIEKYAPFIASALQNSTLDVANLSGNALPLAKGIVKSHMAEALELSKQNGANWLHSQLGDFQRYMAIVHSQRTSVGRHVSEMQDNAPVLFSEILPAHILRYLISDLIPDSYDARLLSSIDALYNPSSELGQKITTLVSMSRMFNEVSNSGCESNFIAWKEALLAISKDPSLHWLSPISTWLNNVTYQQLTNQAIVEWGIMKQNELGQGIHYNML